MATAPNVKHTWTLSIKNDSGAAVVADPPLIITADAEVNFAVQIPAGETAEIDAPITVANIKSCFLSTSQAGTLNTNASDGSGGQTMALVASRAVTWNDTLGTACPFTPNITKFFITNSGSVVMNCRGGFLLQE